MVRSWGTFVRTRTRTRTRSPHADGRLGALVPGQ